jgi:lambda family phage minor tail protein L
MEFEQMGINADIQKLEPGALVELFELDASGIGGEILRFHGYMQVGPIFWQGQRYEPWAIQAEGFEQVGEGQQPSPTLRVGNIGQDAQGRPLAGVISSLCVHLDDLVGARVVARRTLGRYLDAANFPEGNPSADPREELPPEIWIVQQKTLETAQVVEFTLASALDFNGQKLPDRPIIAGVCAWLRKGGYRGPYCGYTGGRMFDLNGNRVTDPTLDRCSGLMSDCKKRFGEYEVINFGGFPSADLIRG